MTPNFNFLKLIIHRILVFLMVFGPCCSAGTVFQIMQPTFRYRLLERITVVIFVVIIFSNCTGKCQLIKR